RCSAGPAARAARSGGPDMKQMGPLFIFAVAFVAALVVPLIGSEYAVSFSIQLLIFLVLAYSWNLIGGYTGYTHFGQVGFFGTGIYLSPLGDLKPLYYAVAAIAAVMMVLTWRLDNSRLGLKLLAIREDENAAESLGIPTTRLKIGAFAASAVAPAAMGCLYAV